MLGARRPSVTVSHALPWLRFDVIMNHSALTIQYSGCGKTTRHSMPAYFTWALYSPTRLYPLSTDLEIFYACISLTSLLEAARNTETYSCGGLVFFCSYSILRYEHYRMSRYPEICSVPTPHKRKFLPSHKWLRVWPCISFPHNVACCQSIVCDRD